MNKCEGLHELIIWGHGYLCILMNIRVHWLPARCVRPDPQHQKQSVASAQSSNAEQHTDHQSDGPSTSREYSPVHVRTVLKSVTDF